MDEVWSYTGDKQGSFSAVNADRCSRLYFPLMNNAGMRCSVTPELKGDISGGFNRYLMPPVVTEDLHRSLNARYVWIRPEGGSPWTINGLAPAQLNSKWSDNHETSTIEARPGAFTLHRRHPDLPLEVSITLTVPASQHQVELWKVVIRNRGTVPVAYTPYFALPLFGRHADHLRDHRQVTTMFQHVYREDAGVCIKPTIVHDESGHKINEASYFALFYDGEGNLPDRIWSRMQDFIGEGGAMNHPAAVWKDEDEPNLVPGQRHGVESISAVSFPLQNLDPGSEASYVAVIGITVEGDHQTIAGYYNSCLKFDAALNDTLTHWTDLTNQVGFYTGDTRFDEWTHWLAFQLKCRQIFGNSFLPDFGYGRGGRGWRDLWQDLLSIFLVDPESARSEMVNNLKGIRIDGSNATIIGNTPGEFKSDRNNIPRTWCDHGAWPLLVVDFYIQQTGDFDVLWESIPYWKDRFIHRSLKQDPKWIPEQGHWLIREDGKIYESSVLEHLLIQQLSAFFNVGEHNILLLEGADWNDTLDMARTRGESVCFQSFYAGNLSLLIGWLEEFKSKGLETIPLLNEIGLLLDRTMDQTPLDYRDPKQRRSCLHNYFDSVGSRVSGKHLNIPVEELIADLRFKENHFKEQVRRQEWIQRADGGYFNGHYNDRGEPMHGRYPEGWRMDLTSQVMPVIFEVANDEQIKEMYQAVSQLLSSPDDPGLRLCTPFPEIDMEVGRITGFVYGHKEHGSKWMQQNIMFVYGLYKRDHPLLAESLLRDIFLLAHDSTTARHFPGIPSYYEPDNRGAYMYLTGSSAWLFLTLVTQVFGVRGIKGDLVLNPKIPVWLFDRVGEAGIRLRFLSKRLHITFQNPHKKSPDQYRITQMIMDGVSIAVPDQKEVIIRGDQLSSSNQDEIEIRLLLD